MKKKLVIIGIAVVFFAGMLVYYKQLQKHTEMVLGPVTENLSGFKKWNLILECSQELSAFTTPADESGIKTIIEISEGQSAQELAADLEDLRIIRSADVFLTYLTYSGGDLLLRPGRYAVNSMMSPVAIANAISGDSGKLITFAFLPGMRLEEIAELVDLSGLSFSGEEFLTAATHFPSETHPSGGTNLEGYLLPGSYEMERSISLDDFLMGFVNEFNVRVKPLEEKFAENGLTLNEGVTLASMVQREAMDPAEYRRIAAVFYNRTRAGMKLESDPTAQYGIGWDEGSRSWWKMPLEERDVMRKSEYNTYTIKGFPPHPICACGLDVLEAAANPEGSDYYYFRLKCDGTPRHNFSRTITEHIAYACEE